MGIFLCLSNRYFSSMNFYSNHLELALGILSTFMIDIVIARPRFHSNILKMSLLVPLGRYRSWPIHIAGQYGS